MDTIFRLLQGQRTTMAIAAMVALAAAVPMLMLGSQLFPAAVVSAYGQQESNSTITNIKVNGEATANIAPDQATITIGLQSQPADLEEALEQQQQKIDQITDAIMNATTGDNNDSTSVIISQQTVNPFHSSSGVVPSNNITFNIYASIGIRTDIDELPGLINRLAEADFGFENIYIDPSYPGSLLSGVSDDDDAPPAILPVSLSSGNGSTGNGSGMLAPPPTEDPTDNNNNNNLLLPEQENQLLTDPVTITVSLVTKPDVLENAIAEYEEKYQALLDITEEAGLSQDQVQIGHFNIQPVYYGSSQIEGYNTYTQLVVRTDPENIEAINSAVQELGDAYVEGVSLSVSDSAIDSARQDLNQQALDSAQSRADEIASQLGMEVVGIKSIDVSSGAPSGYPGEIRHYRGVDIAPYYYYQGVTGQLSVSMVVEFELR